MIVSGGKIIDQCGYCDKYVTLNKWCGSLHRCLTDEERAWVDLSNQAMLQQQTAQPSEFLKRFNQPIKHRPKLTAED